MVDVFGPGIEAYAERHTSAPPQYLVALEAESRALSDDRGRFLTGPLEGRVLKMLVQMLGAKRVLEIGCFTGYSALCMAEGLPRDGSLVTCEIDEEHAAIARRYIAGSPFAAQIEIRMGAAVETLVTLAGPFDFVFIDADKENYLRYFEASLALLAAGGVIAVDNTLWYGRPLDVERQDVDTRAMRAFNAHVVADARVECVVLTVRDGLTLVRRRD